MAKKKSLKKENMQPVVEDSDQFYSESETDSEFEDETGDLVTPAIDNDIDKLLRTIREAPEELRDKNRKWFPDIGAEGTGEIQNRQRPEKVVRLKDFQREQLLRSHYHSGGEEEVSKETPEEQRQREKEKLLHEIHTNVGGSDAEGSDDDFLQKRTVPRDVPDLIAGEALPDPKTNPDEFLNSYLSGRSWAKPAEREKVPTYSEVIGENEDSDSFDDLAEQFESAYNFRYEDPAAADIVSYARNQSTIRRSQMSSRQRQRQRKRDEHERQEEQRKHDISQLRKTKIGEVANKLERLQAVLGEEDQDVAAMITKEDLEGDWDDNEWEQRMQKLFGDEFYAREDRSWSKHEEANADFEDGEYGVEESQGSADIGDTYTDNPANAHGDAKNEEGAQQNMDFNGGMQEKLKQMSKRDLKRAATEFVDANTDLLMDETYRPTATFRYREVEPESFGLSARDILLANDKQLNQFAGLKKLASYRDPEKMQRDRKRYGKAKRLREWRREVFNSEEQPGLDQWKQLQREVEREMESQYKKRPREQSARKSKRTKFAR